MEQELRSNLLILADKYSERVGLKQSTVAKKVAGDGRFFKNITSGMTFTTRKYDLVVTRFHENWPAGLKWPERVVRPSLTQEGADADG